jgi:hypothetical protein
MIAPVLATKASACSIGVMIVGRVDDGSHVAVHLLGGENRRRASEQAGIGFISVGVVTGDGDLLVRRRYDLVCDALVDVYSLTLHRVLGLALGDSPR